jgi:hypothetical protein
MLCFEWNARLQHRMRGNTIQSERMRIRTRDRKDDGHIRSRAAYSASDSSRINIARVIIPGMTMTLIMLRRETDDRKMGGGESRPHATAPHLVDRRHLVQAHTLTTIGQRP